MSIIGVQFESSLIIFPPSLQRKSSQFFTAMLSFKAGKTSAKDGSPQGQDDKVGENRKKRPSKI